ncbi:RNA polymerase sigma factor [Microbacterium trichothecenolyticum]|uniref:RNA polymerase sigma factor n=1 Tax=Microbacterium trichothecenolyticum TaxID=69370 RepID=UPI0035BE5715
MSESESRPEASDSQLLFQMCRGDERAYRALFRRHERSSYRVALALVRSTWDAEEVVGTAFFELWRRRESVRIVEESVLPWLLTTVSYAAKNQIRGRLRYQRLLRRVPDAGTQHDHADEVARMVDAITLTRDVETALAALNARDAGIVILCIVQELSYADAAVVLGVPEGTVKSRLSRVKARLRVDLNMHAPGLEGVEA